MRLGGLLSRFWRVLGVHGMDGLVVGRQVARLGRVTPAVRDGGRFRAVVALHQRLPVRRAPPFAHSHEIFHALLKHGTTAAKKQNKPKGEFKICCFLQFFLNIKEA